MFGVTPEVLVLLAVGGIAYAISAFCAAMIAASEEPDIVWIVFPWFISTLARVVVFFCAVRLAHWAWYWNAASI